MRVRAPMTNDSAGSRRQRRSTSVGSRVDAVSAGASIASRRPRSFFWPITTQQVTRMVRTLSLRDVSAAIAAAGAFALWALALSLLVV
jgi:hypothetical protein